MPTSFRTLNESNQPITLRGLMTSVRDSSFSNMSMNTSEDVLFDKSPLEIVQNCISTAVYKCKSIQEEKRGQGMNGHIKLKF
jgi:hypothetical protein